jgi:hypothetical protein
MFTTPAEITARASIYPKGNTMVHHSGLDRRYSPANNGMLARMEAAFADDICTVTRRIDNLQNPRTS